MKKVKPPKLAESFFRWYCDNAMIEDLHGDLEELFEHDVSRMPLNKAKLLYYQRVISLVFSYAIKKRKRNAAYHTYSITSINPAMLKNYFVIATRNLFKHKLFTAINVFGLAIGMSISLLFIAMLSFVFRYDEFHVNKDRIFRVITHGTDPERTMTYASSPVQLAESLNDYSSVEQVVKINSSLADDVILNTSKIPLRGYYIEPNFLDVFSFPMLKGSATSLIKPNTIIITEKTALKLFASTDVIGKLISFSSLGDFEITGIIKDHPKNSHMQFEALASYSTLRKSTMINENLWKDFKDNYIYLLLKDNHSTENIVQSVNKVAHSIYKSSDDFTATFSLQKLSDIVPGPELRNAIGVEWDLLTMSIFLVFTLLILLPACFNYTNISISRALKRMKEIGLRKVMGGQQKQIFFQFITETIIITLIALILSYFIFTAIRAEFLSMLVGSDSLDLSTNIQVMMYFIGFALLVGFVAGIVPALYFSKLNPIQALKTKASGNRKSGFTIRKVLIVSQFALSLGFIMSVVVVMSQYRYTLNHDFGFKQENILDVDLQGTDVNRLKNEFSKLSFVKSISMSSHVMGTSSSGSSWVLNGNGDSLEVYQMFVDEHYISNLGLKLISGNNFNADSSSKNHVIVNEEFLKAHNIRDASASIDQSFVLDDGREVTIKGVVKNFHYMHLKEPIKSFFFRYDPSKFRYANVSIASGDAFKDLSQMEEAWNSINSEAKMQARFFDDEIEDTYSFYFVLIKICGFLGLLAITISCLGLLGMVVFTVENRIKEVGIRKVMGATSANLTILLSKDFLRLMCIAAMIAIPITYVLFDKFILSIQFYRMSIGIIEISLSLLIMLGLGLTTILSQTLKAAKANPVDTLRYE